MRFGWSGWRRWPPWLVGYVGFVLVAASVMVFLLGIGSCTSAYGNGLANPGEAVVGLVTLLLGVLMMRAGVRMIRAELYDEDAD